ncbi:hypothetical protein CEUSTIGMA_g10521.t1 [Chlamydomonas eustigma]|uniref:Protein kinase domain-containing protein n=1 Tax=Chlamydomonas eustigma TaxID=1157962 RepID=A0A250XJ36_9CHLO|nr:hypothetical protein CEUSTIGMA_g10521.t1 [Chlamydomonas eustigma]|eukprot:GAX83095.1 hypothetical protein CEUSTIGMA_g10521.t1 [Chlamydomonas eustigma]
MSGREHSQLLAISETCPAALHQRESWSIQDFSLIKKVGSGAVSSVYYALCKRSCFRVAIKIYNKSKLTRLNLKQIEREISIHASLHHPHIVEFYAAFEDDNFIYLVLEYAEGGDLFDAVKQRGGRLSEAVVVQHVLHPYLSALMYMHKRGVIHRDVKPENTVFTRDHVLKVTDFGLAVNSAVERPVTRLGTLDYMAPEVLRCPDKHLPNENKERSDLAYTEAVDAWAMGVLAYELIVGRSPFGMADREGTACAITQIPHSFPPWVSKGAASFITAALDKCAATRAPILVLLNHPWMAMHISRDKPLQQFTNVRSLQRIGSGPLGFSSSTFTSHPTATTGQHPTSAQQHLAYVSAMTTSHASMLRGSCLQPQGNDHISDGIINTFVNAPGLDSIVKNSSHILPYGSSRDDLRPVKRALHRSAIACMSDGSGGVHRAGGVFHSTIPTIPDASSSQHDSPGSQSQWNFIAPFTALPPHFKEPPAHTTLVSASPLGIHPTLNQVATSGHGDLGHSAFLGSSLDESSLRASLSKSSSFKRRAPEQEDGSNSGVCLSPVAVCLSPTTGRSSSSSNASPFSLFSGRSTSGAAGQQQTSQAADFPARTRVQPHRTFSSQLLQPARTSSSQLHQPSQQHSGQVGIKSPTPSSTNTALPAMLNQYQHQPSRFSRAKRDAPLYSCQKEVVGKFPSPFSSPLVQGGGDACSFHQAISQHTSEGYSLQPSATQFSNVTAAAAAGGWGTSLRQQQQPWSSFDQLFHEASRMSAEWAFPSQCHPDTNSPFPSQCHPDSNSPFPSQCHPDTNSPFTPHLLYLSTTGDGSGAACTGCSTPNSHQASGRSSCAGMTGSLLSALNTLQVSKLNLGGSAVHVNPISKELGNHGELSGRGGADCSNNWGAGRDLSVLPAAETLHPAMTLSAVDAMPHTSKGLPSAGHMQADCAAMWTQSHGTDTRSPVGLPLSDPYSSQPRGAEEGKKSLHLTVDPRSRPQRLTLDLNSIQPPSPQLGLARSSLPLLYSALHPNNDTEHHRLPGSPDSLVTWNQIHASHPFKLTPANAANNTAVINPVTNPGEEAVLQAVMNHGSNGGGCTAAPPTATQNNILQLEQQQQQQPAAYTNHRDPSSCGFNKAESWDVPANASCDSSSTVLHGLHMTAPGCPSLPTFCNPVVNDLEEALPLGELQPGEMELLLPFLDDEGQESPSSKALDVAFMDFIMSDEDGTGH